MQVVTVDQLRSSLRWPNITEATSPSRLRVFSAWPTAKWLPQIEFVFNDGVDLLYQLGFGPWHGHFEGWSDERLNIRRAVATAHTLVAGARCLLVERGAEGKYLCSGVYRRNETPRTLSEDFERLERIVFNEPIESIDLDMTSYHRTKRGRWIEHSWRTRLKQVYAGHTPDSADLD